jgi:hypothetical protein
VAAATDMQAQNRPRQFLHRAPHYWGDKTITAAGHIREATRTIAVKRFTQRRNMNAKTDVLDKNAWPNLRDQLPLANDFAWSVSQSEQDVERAAAELDDLSVLHQQALRRKELE